MTGCSEIQREKVQSNKDKSTLYRGIEFTDERMERGVKQAAAL